MKLINGDKLMADLCVCEEGCEQCQEIRDTIKLCTLDPAELDKLNMGALWLVGKLKEQLAIWKTQDEEIKLTAVAQKAPHQVIDRAIQRIELVSMVTYHIKSLESRLDAEGKEVLVKARAWDSLYGAMCKHSGSHIMTYGQLVLMMKNIRTQARTDLEAGRDTGEKKEGGEHG